MADFQSWSSSRPRRVGDMRLGVERRRQRGRFPEDEVHGPAVHVEGYITHKKQPAPLGLP